MDVAIVAGAGVREWPTLGATTLSRICSQFGLKCGLYGGSSGNFRGLITRAHEGSTNPGGWVIFQDAQSRIHEISAKSVVRMVARNELPDPFFGWDSMGWLPLSSAEILSKDSGLQFYPQVAIYGATPRSIKFAIQLLHSHRTEVILIPTPEQLLIPQVWSVDFYRFLMLGGKWIQDGASLSQAILSAKSPLIWNFKLGSLDIDISHLIVAGPFGQEPSSSELEREYPLGSLRFEMECVSVSQNEFAKAEKYSEPYLLLRVQEEEVARSIALKIVRALKRDLGENREAFEQLQKSNQMRRKKWSKFKAHPVRYPFTGKLLDKTALQQIRSFEGVPKRLHELKTVASIECVESIGCQICQEACTPEAIRIDRTQNLFLDETKCTACGFCLQVCPSQVPILLHASPKNPTVQITVADATESATRISAKETVEVLNRKGEYLGIARVTQVDHPVPSDGIYPRLITIEVPQHLAWEARAVRSAVHVKRIQEESLSDAPQNLTKDFLQSRFEILLDGEKRWVREKISISVALYELGKARPGDRLICGTGHCGLCSVMVDGQKQLACKTLVRRGMMVRRLDTKEEQYPLLTRGPQEPTPKETTPFCFCNQVSVGDIESAIQKGQIEGMVSAKNFLGIGDGRCHGMYCESPLRRRCESQKDSQFISWELPDSDWQIS